MPPTVRLLAMPLLGALLVAAGGQRQALPPPGQTSPTSSSPAATDGGALDHLLVLPGDWVDVRYVSDSLDRAARVQARLETVHQLWQPLARDRLVWRAAVVLEPQWRALVPDRPWGVAARSASGTFLVPAVGDSGTVATVERLLGGPVPQSAGMPLFGSPEEAGSLVVCDILLQIEAARSFVRVTGVRGEEPWIAGVAAHLAARLAWQAAEPGRTLEIVGLLDRIAAAHGGAAAHRLADYRDSLEYERALWFDAQFVRGADAIWVEEGRRGSARLLKRWIRNRSEPISRTDLEKAYPALVDWQRAAFAP